MHERGGTRGAGEKTAGVRWGRGTECPRGGRGWEDRSQLSELYGITGKSLQYEIHSYMLPFLLFLNLLRLNLFLQSPSTFLLLF